MFDSTLNQADSIKILYNGQVFWFYFYPQSNNFDLSVNKNNFCNGDTNSTISVINPSGNQIQWNINPNNSGSIISRPDGTYLFNWNNNYYGSVIMVANSYNNCKSLSSSLTLVKNKPITTLFTCLSDNDTIELTNQTETFDSLKWFVNYELYSNKPIIKVYKNAYSDLSVKLLTTYKTCLDSSFQYLSLANCSIKNLDDISVFPNPCNKGKLFFSSILISSSCHYQIVNLNGIISEDGICNSNIIDVSRIKSGCYIIRLIFKNQVYTRLVIINN